MGIGNSEQPDRRGGPWRPTLRPPRRHEGPAARAGLRPTRFLAVLALWVAAASGPTVAQADWREDIGTFRVGIVAEPGSGNALAGLAELNDAYTRALGLKVEFFVARDYSALIDAQAASQLEYAVYSATAYAAAVERCACVEPLAAPVGEDGSIGIRSILIARDGRLSSLADLENRRIALLPPDSVAGHQLPVSGLLLPGGPLTGAEPFLVHAESALAAETMLADGSVDAIFGWMPAAPPGAPDIEGGTLARLQAAGMERSSLTIAWKSDVLRYGPHAVLSSLDPEPKRRLAAFLIALREADPQLYERVESHHLGGFVAASPADYDTALSMVRGAAGRPVRR